jgi:hypothetical protein
VERKDICHKKVEEIVENVILRVQWLIEHVQKWLDTYDELVLRWI